MMLITTTAACVLAIYPVVKCAMRRRLLIDEDGVALIVVALIAVGDDGFAANRASTNAVTIVENSDVPRKSLLAPWRLLWVGLGMDGCKSKTAAISLTQVSKFPWATGRIPDLTNGVRSAQLHPTGRCEMQGSASGSL